MENQTDNKIGFLTIIGSATETEMKCLCKCGRILNVSKTNLENGSVVSCPVCNKKIEKKIAIRKELINKPVTKVHKFQRDFQMNKLKKKQQTMFLGHFQNKVLFKLAKSLGLEYSTGVIKKETIIKDILNISPAKRNKINLQLSIEFDGYE